MRRLLLTTSLLFLPLLAVGQTLGGNPATDAATLKAQASRNNATTVVSRKNGHTLAIQSKKTTVAEAQDATRIAVTPGAGGTVSSSTLQYGLGSNITAHAGVSQQRSWVNQVAPVVGGEVGATYSEGRYSLGVAVAQDQVTNAAALPRVLPGAAPGVNGLTDFDSSTQLTARGRLALTSNSGIVLGASMGRIRLLPGNLLGLGTLDQKALSFGVDHGSISGNIIGRTMQPEPGMLNSYNTDRRWNSIDLGVTWHLPWQGSLSFGAQNVWSSGNSANTPAGPEPDQSRTPYVQYHQDL